MVGSKMVGSLLVLTLLFSFLAVFAPSVAAPQRIVRVAPLEIEVVSGEEFTVAVVVEDPWQNMSLCGIDMTLSWNTTYLDYVSHTAMIPVEDYPTPIDPSPYAGIIHGHRMWISPHGGRVDETAGTYWVAVYSCSGIPVPPPFNGSGTVVIMTFRAKNLTCWTNTTLHFMSVFLANINGQYIPHICKDGIVTGLDILETAVVMDPPLVEYDYYAKGENLTVAVRIEDVEDLYGLDIMIAWNTTWIEYVSHVAKIPVESYPDGVLHGPVLWVSPPDGKINETAGTYRVACSSFGIPPPPSFNGIGIAFEMTFRIKDYPTYPDPDVNFYIEFVYTDLASTTCIIPHTTQNCHIIFHPFPLPLPTIVPDDYPTIQQAIDSSKPGHMILVKPGIYNESLLINKSVSLIGVDRDTTIISQTLTISADNFTIRGFTIDCACAKSTIVLNSSSNCEIRDNKLGAVSTGIGIYGGSGNKIMGNDILGPHGCCCGPPLGIDVWNSSGNIIMRNTVYADATSLRLRASNLNHIYHNVFTANWLKPAVTLIRSNSNVIEGNTLYDDSFEMSSRIELWASCNNSIFHNNFMGFWGFGGGSASQDEKSTNNTWDDGYPSGGNYWIDYEGSDNHSGPYQNETGSDGIGDESRNITGGGQDRYPLMNKYHMHFNDLDILKINLDVQGCCVGRPVKIMVTVISEDERLQTSNLTVSVYDGTLTEKVTKHNVIFGACVTVTLETKSLTGGRYYVKAEVAPVPGETDTADNSLIGNVLLMQWVGDIDGNRKVDIYDIVIASAAYRSKPGDPNWNPYADLAPLYGIVNIYDMVTIAYHYGKTYP